MLWSAQDSRRGNAVKAGGRRAGTAVRCVGSKRRRPRGTLPRGRLTSVTNGSTGSPGVRSSSCYHAGGISFRRARPRVEPVQRSCTWRCHPHAPRLTMSRESRPHPTSKRPVPPDWKILRRRSQDDGGEGGRWWSTPNRTGARLHGRQAPLGITIGRGGTPAWDTSAMSRRSVRPSNPGRTRVRIVPAAISTGAPPMHIRDDPGKSLRQASCTPGFPASVTNVPM